MLSVLEIDGQALCSVKDAAQETTYSRDYVTRLAREGKIIASYIGRQWFVNIDSLQKYAESAALEQEVRKKYLSEERKQERRLREVIEHQHTLRLKKANTLHVRAVVVASLTLGLGVLVGQPLFQYVSQAGYFFPSPVPLVQQAQVSQTVSPLSSGSNAALTPSNSDSVLSTEGQGITQVSSQTQYPIHTANEGVFLLPSTGSVEDVSALFSDVVEVKQLADGVKVVVPVDAAGNQIGREVPFLVVPITEDSI